MLDEKVLNRSEVLRGWVELVRPPNLFTVPGDVLAGASLALASPGEITLLWPAMVVSFLLYTSGLILNDYYDRNIDRVERPERPIPSGRVSPQAALAAGLALIIAAVMLGYLFPSIFLTTLVLTAVILLYNGPARKIPMVGILVMGLCRGCNLLLGAAICVKPFSSMALAGAGIEFLYIASVSTLAYNETQGSPTFIKRWLPFISLLSLPVLLLLTGISLPSIFRISIFLVFVTLARVFYLLWRTGPDGNEVPKTIGELIRSLILVQCALIAVSMGDLGYRSYHLAAIVSLLMLFPVSGWTAKKFYGS